MMYTLSDSIPKDKRAWVMENLEDVEAGKYQGYYCHCLMIRGELIAIDPEEYAPWRQTLTFYYNKEASLKGEIRTEG